MSARTVLAAAAAALLTGGLPAQADVLVQAATGSGEPEVAINPGDPSNIVVGKNDTGISFTTDAGATWHPVALENPGDAVLAVLPDGTFVYSALDGEVRASRDGGAHWAIVGNWVGALAAQVHRLAASGAVAVAGREVSCSAPAPEGPGSTDLAEGPGPHEIGCDRPWLAADPQTGRLYVSFTSHDDAAGGAGAPLPWELSTLACRSTVLTNPLLACGRQYVAASGDGGRTWSAFRPLDGAGWPGGPTGGFSSGPVAAHGVLATAYLAASAPGSTCGPCLVFETSRDDGTTWTRHLVPADVASLGPLPTDQSLLFEPYAAADPSRPGRYAVMVLDATRTHLLVRVSDDAGVTWRGPAVLGEPGDGTRNLPWLAYGPGGALGAVWRTLAPDGTYAAWAAIASAGDTRFGAPVRLSSAASPGPVSQFAGDDASDVALGRDALYGVWGDRRGGALGVRLGVARFAPAAPCRRRHRPHRSTHRRGHAAVTCPKGGR